MVVYRVSSCDGCLQCFSNVPLRSIPPLDRSKKLSFYVFDHALRAPLIIKWTWSHLGIEMRWTNQIRRNNDQFDSTAFVRSNWNLIRHGLSKFFFDRKKYAVESKRAKNCIFDVVGSWHILKAFHRKEAVKCVKRNLIPVYIPSVCTVCTACMKGVCVCACACFVSRIWRWSGQRTAQTAQDNMFYLLTVVREKYLYNMRLCTACTVHEPARKLVITPHHTVPSQIPTTRDVAQVFASRK